jgi:hypothetical protein
MANIAAGAHAPEFDANTIHAKQELVGWVFGRVIGFPGADKPMLPGQSFPPMGGPVGR